VHVQKAPKGSPQGVSFCPSLTTTKH
jgi:hypothetical protein